jgi:hypothetical protein
MMSPSSPRAHPKRNTVKTAPTAGDPQEVNVSPTEIGLEGTPDPSEERTAASTVALPDDVPVSQTNLRLSLDSSRYWIAFLPEYANDMQRRADRWAIAAGLLAALTGLSAWADVEQSSNILLRVVVVVASLSSATCSLVPRVKNYGEMAGHARELCSQYRRVYGHLLDLWHNPKALVTPQARKVIDDFYVLAEARDRHLRYVPLQPTGRVGRDQDGLAQWPADVYRLARRRQSIPI